MADVERERGPGAYGDHDPEDSYDAADPPGAQLADVAGYVAERDRLIDTAARRHVRLQWAHRVLDRLAAHDDPDIAEAAQRLRRRLGPP
jgi:hypothetical protein